MDSQVKDILKDLERGDEITPLDALSRYGCMRLGARIYDLKHMGYEIRTEFRTVKTRNGGKARVAVYSLEVEND